MADEVTESPDSSSTEQQSTNQDNPQYAPGVLCAVEVSDKPIVDCDENEKNAIKALNRKSGQRDMPSRREQVIRVWEARLFDRGFQHLLPRQNGGWELPTVGTGYGYGEDEDRSQWEIDIYSSYRKIICAALTREVPTVRFEPTDPDTDVDITAARSAEKLREKIERDNHMKALQGEGARFLWTDGLSVTFTRYVKDAQGFGYEPEPTGDVPEDEDTGQAATALPTGNQEGQPPVGMEGGSSPSGSAEGLDGGQVSSGASEAQPGIDATRIPRGREFITVDGALSWKLPIKANCLGECSYARYAREIDVATTKAMFPKYADEIKPTTGSGGSGSGGDDLERLARINVLLGVEDNFVTEDSAVNDVTVQKYFYRPAELFNISDKPVRNSLLQKFPDGLYCTFAGEVMVEARNASMDDYLTITFADAGDGIHRPGLGQPLIAPQKVLNTLAELAFQYFVHGVPMTYMDDDMFDVEAIKNQDNVPGGIRPFEADGTQITGFKWFREDPVPFPEQLLLFTQWIMDEVSQLMSGAYPALFGGDTGSNDTGIGILAQRDQALGRLGLPWRNIKESTAAMMRQAVQCLARNGEGVIKIGGTGKNQVDVQDLKGNFLCFPESDENFPESYTQIQNRFALIVQDAATNPFFQTILDDPENLRLVQKYSGLKDLKIPMLEACDQQLGEIAILFKTGPAPNPELVEVEQELQKLQIAAQRTLDPAAQVALQQATAQLQQQVSSVPPQVSTYPIDVECDDHATHAATCLGIINSPKGRAMKNGTAEEQAAFQNLKLHYIEHVKAQADKQVAPPPPQKPVSQSMNIKDQPPNVAAQMAQKAGIKASPQDFAAQDAAEAIAKHPVALTTGAVQ